MRRTQGTPERGATTTTKYSGNFRSWGEVAASQQTNFPPLQVTKIIQVSQPELYKDRDFLHRKYVLERLSTSEIAAEIFSSRTAVANALKRFQIPLRPIDANTRNRTQIRYGEAWRKRQVTIHQREQANIEKMKTLRGQGFSYWKIADVFNSMKIPTKTGRGRWHARSVQGILAMNSPRHPSQIAPEAFGAS